MNALLYYLIVINVVTFLVYGIDKAASKRGQSQTRLSYAEHKQARPKVKWKAKKGRWRISEATLLMLAVVGGSVGAWLGMKVWHHTFGRRRKPLYGPERSEPVHGEDGHCYLPA